jgi:hypothetical protein
MRVCGYIFFVCNMALEMFAAVERCACTVVRFCFCWRGCAEALLLLLVVV